MGLLGGLALFLYGMQMMSIGLESAAGNKLKLIMEKLTANRFVGVLTGAFVTAIIQSSSATTVMVVGFVNSGMMTLRQAVWIIMGANIGTTITGQLIALDVGAFAPFVAFLGVAAIVFLKSEKVNHVGEIMAGLGILFIGMDMMSTAMAPLGESKEFVSLLTKFSNPILGILAGCVFTALIQSSSASVGILQALAGSGVIGLNSAAYILFGQNIGTCITALLASIGAGKNAKRATLIHIMFNVIGTILFTILCLATPLISIIQHLTPASVSSQIANLHTLFNVVTTILLIPFGVWLTKLAEVLLKEEPEQQSARTHYLLDIKHINGEKLGTSVMYMEGVKKELVHMLQMAKENVHDAFDIFITPNQDTERKIEEREDTVDYLNKELSKYITHAMTYENTTDGSQAFNALFTVTGNIERISDHAVNIAEYSDMIQENKIKFSPNAIEEIGQLQGLCDRMLEHLLSEYSDVIHWHEKIACLEQKIDDITVDYRNNMYARIKQGACSDEGSILFSEMLTDFERIGDHALNISNEMVKIKMLEKK